MPVVKSERASIFTLIVMAVFIIWISAMAVVDYAQGVRYTPENIKYPTHLNR